MLLPVFSYFQSILIWRGVGRRDDGLRLDLSFERRWQALRLSLKIRTHWQKLGMKTIFKKDSKNIIMTLERKTQRTFSNFLRSLGLRCFLGRDAPSSSSLSSPPLAGLKSKTCCECLLCLVKQSKWTTAQCSRLTSSSSCGTSSLRPHPLPARCRCPPFSSSSSSLAGPRQSRR